MFLSCGFLPGNCLKYAQSMQGLIDGAPFLTGRISKDILCAIKDRSSRFGNAGEHFGVIQFQNGGVIQPVPRIAGRMQRGSIHRGLLDSVRNAILSLMLQRRGGPCPYGSALKDPYSGKNKASIEEMIGALNTFCRAYEVARRLSPG